MLLTLLRLTLMIIIVYPNFPDEYTVYHNYQQDNGNLQVSTYLGVYKRKEHAANFAGYKSLSGHYLCLFDETIPVRQSDWGYDEMILNIPQPEAQTRIQWILYDPQNVSIFHGESSHLESIHHKQLDMKPTYVIQRFKQFPNYPYSTQTVCEYKDKSSGKLLNLTSIMGKCRTNKKSHYYLEVSYCCCSNHIGTDAVIPGMLHVYDPYPYPYDYDEGVTDYYAVIWNEETANIQPIHDNNWRRWEFVYPFTNPRNKRKQWQMRENKKNVRIYYECFQQSKYKIFDVKFYRDELVITIKSYLAC